jgi:hypothetical protein
LDNWTFLGADLIELKRSTKKRSKNQPKNSNKFENQSEILERRISFLAYLAECETFS